ncbi:TPA: hypothetical protein ACGO17_001996, partial [Streptococcus suis]
FSRPKFAPNFSIKFLTLLNDCSCFALNKCEYDFLGRDYSREKFSGSVSSKTLLEIRLAQPKKHIKKSLT